MANIIETTHAIGDTVIYYDSDKGKLNKVFITKIVAVKEGVYYGIKSINIFGPKYPRFSAPE